MGLSWGSQGQGHMMANLYVTRKCQRNMHMTCIYGPGSIWPRTFSAGSRKSRGVNHKKRISLLLLFLHMRIFLCKQLQTAENLSKNVIVQLFSS